MKSKKAMTKTERIAYDKMATNLYRLEEDHYMAARLEAIVPDAWHTLRFDIDVEEPKDKVTLYLDRSVAKYFRAMGQGYQKRINRILASFAQMSIAGLLEEDEHLEKQSKMASKLVRAEWGE